MAAPTERGPAAPAHRIRTTFSRLRGDRPLRPGEIPPALLWGGHSWPDERADAPLCLELGFGTGESLLQAATGHPGWNFLGAEVLAAGLRRLAGAAQERGLRNLRLYCGDARDLLQALDGGSVQAACLFFPDPWPKRRHHKRRLVTAEFLAALCRVLCPGGVLRCATDWPDYGRQMQALLAACPQLQAVPPSHPQVRNVPGRHPSAFARRAQREGRSIQDFCHIRLPG